MRAMDLGCAPCGGARCQETSWDEFMTRGGRGTLERNRTEPQASNVTCTAPRLRSGAYSLIIWLSPRFFVRTTTPVSLKAVLSNRLGGFLHTYSTNRCFASPTPRMRSHDMEWITSRCAAACNGAPFWGRTIRSARQAVLDRGTSSQANSTDK